MSLLLLAVAALGYAALQIQTLGATDDALIRTQSITLLHSAAEQIRINAVDNVINQTLISEQSFNNTSTNETASDVLAHYAKQFAIEPSVSTDTALASIDCQNQPCLPKDRATYDVLELKARAANIGVTLGLVACPNGQVTANNTAISSYCLVAAWNATTATRGDTSQDCFEAQLGGYSKEADCVFMEAY